MRKEPRNFRNWLVTGSNGFIGSNFVRMLVERYEIKKIVCLDALTYAAIPWPELYRFINPSSGNESYIKFVKGNIRERNLIREIIDNEKIDIVVNFAAETHVDNSLLRPSEFLESNVDGVYQLLEAIRESKKMPRLHHISTDEVFGSISQEEVPWTESSPYRPNSPYAATKASADHLVRSFSKAYGIDYTLTYSSNCFGDNQYPEKLIPRAVFTALREGKIYVYGSGYQLREWKHVIDNCKDIYNVITLGKLNEAYCIGGGYECCVLGVVMMVKNNLINMGFLKSDVEIVNIEDPRGLSQDAGYRMNGSKYLKMMETPSYFYSREDFDLDMTRTVKHYAEKFYI